MHHDSPWASTPTVNATGTGYLLRAISCLQASICDALLVVAPRHRCGGCVCVCVCRLWGWGWLCSGGGGGGEGGIHQEYQEGEMGKGLMRKGGVRKGGVRKGGVRNIRRGRWGGGVMRKARRVVDSIIALLRWRWRRVTEDEDEDEGRDR